MIELYNCRQLCSVGVTRTNDGRRRNADLLAQDHIPRSQDYINSNTTVSPDQRRSTYAISYTCPLANDEAGGHVDIQSSSASLRLELKHSRPRPSMLRNAATWRSQRAPLPSRSHPSALKHPPERAPSIGLQMSQNSHPGLPVFSSQLAFRNSPTTARSRPLGKLT
jgi:hypothetical protein